MTAAVASPAAEPNRLMVAMVLDRAADLLTTAKWSKLRGLPSERMIRRGKRRADLCLVGSVIQARADFGLPFTDKPADELEALGFRRSKRGWRQWIEAVGWNDQQRSKDDVIASLRRGAAIARRGATEAETIDFLERTVVTDDLLRARFRRLAARSAGVRAPLPPAA